MDIMKRAARNGSKRKKAKVRKLFNNLANADPSRSRIKNELQTLINLAFYSLKGLSFYSYLKKQRVLE